MATALTGCGGGGGEKAPAKDADANAAGDKIVFKVANVMATGNNVTMGIEKFGELLEEKSGGTMVLDKMCIRDRSYSVGASEFV